MDTQPALRRSKRIANRRLRTLQSAPNTRQRRSYRWPTSFDLLSSIVTFITIVLRTILQFPFIILRLSLALILDVFRALPIPITSTPNFPYLPSHPSTSPEPSRRGRRFLTERIVGTSTRGRHLPATHAVAESLCEEPINVDIDLQLQVPRGTIREFTQLHECFKYEAPGLLDLFEDPAAVVESSVEKYGVPFSAHRLYWCGPAEDLQSALKVAVSCSLSHLTITNCNLALDDVQNILLRCRALETLDVRQVSAAEPVLDPISPSTRRRYAHNLSSLTLTSKKSLDPLFSRALFPKLQYLSLRLFEEGNQMTFNSLIFAHSRIVSFRLRSSLPKIIEDKIVEDFPNSSDYELDIARIY